MSDIFAGVNFEKLTRKEIREVLLQYYKDRLEEHRKDLEQERREFRNVSIHNSDVTDQGTCLETLEILTRRMSLHSDRIQRIKSVIARIETDPHWYECKGCGESLIKRFETGRYTTRCVSCQEEVERDASRRYTPLMI